MNCKKHNLMCLCNEENVCCSFCLERKQAIEEVFREIDKCIISTSKNGFTGVIDKIQLEKLKQKLLRGEG